MPNAVMPRAVKVATEWLQAQPSVTAETAQRVSYRLSGVFPAIRLTDVGVVERGPEEELRRIQVECWADDYDAAERLSAIVESVLPEARHAWPSGYCAGAAVLAGPFSSPDPSSNRFRHQLDVGLWLYPTP